jgi:AraC-like DNA-binding protein/uncharacterized cupin superfamily protein
MNRNMTAAKPRHDPASGRRLDDSWPADPQALAVTGADGLLQRAEVRFVSAAEWLCLPGWSIPRRRLPTANYSYYLAGKATIHSDDGIIEAAAGDFVMLPSGLAHSARQDPADRVHGLSGHFTARSAGGLDLIALLGFPRLVQCRPRVDDPLSAIPRELARCAARRPPGWQAACDAHVRLLLDHLVRQHGPAFAPPPGPPAVAARLQPFLALVTARLDDPGLTVSELAGAAGISSVRLRGLCRRHLGCSPLAWLHRQRIAEACRLLATGGEPIAGVAERCGFADLVWFHRLFRRATGSTPAAWRAGMG